ncbi:MAG TPA: sialidase family protein [Acidobacteriota bacterium]|nr:sialidase family protein [Acidobacteriota bacterium]
MRILKLVSLLLLILSGACFLILKDQPERKVEGEQRKVSSGKSYINQTRVEPLPRLSALATGFASERVWSGEDDWEPAIATDPSSSYVYQMTTRYSGPKPCNNCALPALVFRASSDGGATWGPDKFIAETSKTQNDPQIEVAIDGTIFAVILNDYVPGIKFTKSTDHGFTWSDPIRLTGAGRKPHWSDKPILAISADGQHVYVAFNASDSYVTASHDFGQTFLDPVKTSNDTRYWFHSAGAVAPNGDVYFGTSDFSQTYLGDANVGVLRSTNQGASWQHIQLDTSKEAPPCDWADGCYLGFFGPTAGLAIDPTGKIMVAYNVGNIAGGAEQIYVRTSTNGTSWSSRSLISANSNTINNAFPVVASGGPNDFRVAWQDDRNQSQTGWNTWYRRTNNGGSSWSAALRLSDATSGAPYKTDAGYFFPYGDYFEMAVDANGTNHVIWGEGDDWIGPGGTWYTSGQ